MQLRDLLFSALPRLLMLLTGIAFPASAAAAQNYIRNGDFSQPYQIGWSTNGLGQVDNASFPVASIAPDPCLEATPSNFPLEITQSVDLPAVGTYVLRADVHATIQAGASSRGSSISLGPAFFGPSEVRTTGVPGRRRLEAKVTVTSAPHTVVVHLVMRGDPLNLNPTFRIDNVELELVSGATLHPVGDLTLSSPQRVLVHTGSAGPVEVYASAGSSLVPFVVPGWLGTWQLDPATMVHVLSIGAIARDEWRPIDYPALWLPELVGRPMHWQALHIATSTPTNPSVSSLGVPNSWAHF